MKRDTSTILPEGISETSIPGLLKVQRGIFADARGKFQEIARVPDLEAVVGEFKILQLQRSEANHESLRGIHAEPFNKLVTLVAGKIFAAVVDLRPESPSFRKFETFDIGNPERFSLFIPRGCGNSFVVTGKTPAIYIYAQDSVYKGPFPSISWNDPELNIPWPVKNPLVSDRDGKDALSLTDFLAKRKEIIKKYLNK